MSNLTEKTYQIIREAIISGELKPGERLIEQRICEDFKVGRSPLRESLRLLQMEGYVDMVPHKGATINKISVMELRSIYDIVAVLEGFATEIAAPKIETKKNKLKKLESIQKELSKAGTVQDYRKWIELNTQFHDFIVESSENSELYKIIRNLRDKIRRYRYFSLIIPGGNIANYVKAHETILDFLSKGKAKKAGQEMRNHVLESKNIVTSFLEEFKDFLG